MFFLFTAILLFVVQFIFLTGKNVNSCKNNTYCNYQLRKMICKSSKNISQITRQDHIEEIYDIVPKDRSSENNQQNRS